MTKSETKPRMIAGVIGLCWFNRRHFDDHRALMSDPDELFDTFDEWLKSAKTLEAQVTAQGKKVVRIPFDPVSFLLHCATTGHLPDGAARSRWAAIETERRFRDRVRG